MKKQIAVGVVSTVDSKKHSAKVYFDDIEFLSGSLPIIKNTPVVTQTDDGTLTVKDWVPEVGESVVCIFIENSTSGFILGAYEAQ